MKAKISLPQDDLCKFCDNVCPENVYDCDILQQAMNSKQAGYKWCWLKLEK
jgi:hypothetical protein